MAPISQCRSLAETVLMQTIEHTRDPVGLVVEQQLRNLANASRESFRLGADAHGKVTAAFGRVKVEGENADITILRLASALLDDPRFRHCLTQSLRSVT